MSESIFDKWNKNIDTEGLQKDIAEAEKNGGSGNFDDLPDGSYEVKIDSMELKESKKGDPMFATQFTVLEGDHKNRKIWMNQIINEGFQIGIVNKFLRSLDVADDVEFKDYVQYNDLIMDIMEGIDEDGLEFLLDYGHTKKGFPTFKIKEVYES